MSDHPLGLSGEPFSPPLTLSSKEAKHLIRRRVSAVGGDGAALFPAETCDEIHRLAGGIPEAIFHLAGEAMRVAAGENASAVSPAHVRDAAGARERPAAAPDDGAATAAARVQAEGPAPERPPIPAAGIALPTEPSASLSKDARAWVSRFLPSSRSGSSRRAPGRAPRAPTIHVATELDPAAAPSAGTHRPPATWSTVALPRGGSRPRGPRRRRRGPGGGVVSAVAVTCIVALVALQYRRGALTSASGPRGIVPTSGPAIAPPTPATESAVTADRTADRTAATTAPAPALVAPPRGSAPSETRTSAGVGTSARGSSAPQTGTSARVGSRARSVVATTTVTAKQVATRAATTATARPAGTRAATTAHVGPPPREAPAPMFGLEVATSIFEDRARSERERLAAAGHRVRLVAAREYGSTVYCVVLGGYAQREAAERAADSLLSGGMVLQARIVTLPPGR